MTENHHGEKRPPEAVRLLQELDKKVEIISGRTLAANEKLDEQNGRLDRHSAEIVDMKLEVRGLGTKIDNLPCDERISSCRRSFDALSTAIDGKKLNRQQSRSTLLAAGLGACITAGAALVIWAISQWLR